MSSPKPPRPTPKPIKTIRTIKTILIAAISLDGKISTNPNKNANFSSKKDKAFFRKEVQKAGVSILGSKTYKAAKSAGTGASPSGLIPKVQHIVMTRTPEKYTKTTASTTFTTSTTSPAILTVDQNISPINPKKQRRHHATTKTPTTSPAPLTFTKDTPRKILKNLEAQGHKTAIISGGSEIYTMFLKANLVDEMYLTITPHWFGKGIPLFQGNPNINFELYKVKKLGENEILLKYRR